jgi:hypothetical protein
MLRHVGQAHQANANADDPRDAGPREKQPGKQHGKACSENKPNYKNVKFVHCHTSLLESKKGVRGVSLEALLSSIVWRGKPPSLYNISALLPKESKKGKGRAGEPSSVLPLSVSIDFWQCK